MDAEYTSAMWMDASVAVGVAARHITISTMKFTLYPPKEKSTSSQEGQYHQLFVPTTVHQVEAKIWKLPSSTVNKEKDSFKAKTGTYNNNKGRSRL
jgi:hypothetical protein